MPKHTHNLVELAERLPSGLASASVPELAELTGYNKTGQYSDENEITKVDADRALKIATNIVNEMCGKL